MLLLAMRAGRNRDIPDFVKIRLIEDQEILVLIIQALNGVGYALEGSTKISPYPSVSTW